MRKATVAKLGLVCGIAMLVVGPTRAQDPTLRPTYGEVNLKAGFEPDPVIKKLQAGGPVRTNKGGLMASVAREPDVILDYTAGTFVLTIFAKSQADTTLHIWGPDGKWHVNDDGEGTGLDPYIRFNAPRSGRYYIWVGTLAPGGTPDADLGITELKYPKKQ